MTDRFWKVAAILLIVGLFYVGAGLHSRSPWTMPAESPAYGGGVTVGTDDAETVFTASEDGKTVYMWQYFGSKPPRYLGKAEAIERQ